ncbi:protein-glutamate O-methyltransferase CheR [Erythrobacter sp. LQ02-29]|uniref:CheR family methyltransferase n=1 Tax=Erythrobacter sp. LQ02-29 TaxID=2920384 RepID=UPI001F4EEA58|nr:CheR family methyltransferase [Erythrobacter sp. LQ02-29]MCP9222818.1 protein-glutamate O-methyltransferase CheR [Erythrobacter sp. LQ02-29]
MKAAIASRPREREFGFGEADHRAIAELAYREVGILLPASKAQMVYGRLAPRVRACGLSSVADYIGLIDSDAPERGRAIDALTTNHTFFFRENHHFDDFNRLVWPDLKARLASGGRVRLWSAACSSGEEPYSWLMSMLGSDRSGGKRLLSGDFRMLSTDVSPSVLATAKAGIYPANVVETVPGPLAKTWLNKSGDGFEVDPALRAAVVFNVLNLLGDWPIRTTFDAIFCRNVMIYFDGPTKARLQARLADALKVGGLLCIGHSERLDGEVARRFEIVGRTSWRKVA